MGSEQHAVQFIREKRTHDAEHKTVLGVFRDVLVATHSGKIYLSHPYSDKEVELQEGGRVTGTDTLWVASKKLTEYTVEGQTFKKARTIEETDLGVPLSTVEIKGGAVFSKTAAFLTVIDLATHRVIGKQSAEVYAATESHFVTKNAQTLTLFGLARGEMVEVWRKEVPEDSAVFLTGCTAIAVTDTKITVFQVSAGGLGPKERQFNNQMDIEDEGEYKVSVIKDWGPFKEFVTIGHTKSIDMTYITHTEKEIDVFVPEEDTDGIQIIALHYLTNFHQISSTILSDTNQNDREIIQGPTVILETETQLFFYNSAYEPKDAPEKYYSTRRAHAPEKEAEIKVERSGGRETEAETELTSTPTVFSPTSQQSSPTTQSPTDSPETTMELDFSSTPSQTPSQTPSHQAPLSLDTLSNTLSTLKTTTTPQTKPSTLNQQPGPIPISNLATHTATHTATHPTPTPPKPFQIQTVLDGPSSLLEKPVQTLTKEIAEIKKTLAECTSILSSIPPIPEETKVCLPQSGILYEIEELLILVKDEEIRLKEALAERKHTSKREKNGIIIEMVRDKIYQIKKAMTTEEVDHAPLIDYINRRIIAAFKMSNTQDKTSSSEEIAANDATIYYGPLSQPGPPIQKLAETAYPPRRNEVVQMLEECLKRIEKTEEPTENLLDTIFKDTESKTFLKNVAVTGSVSTATNTPKPTTTPKPTPGTKPPSLFPNAGTTTTLGTPSPTSIPFGTSPFGTLKGTTAPPSASLFGARPATSPFGTLQGTPGQPAAQPSASPFGTLKGTPTQPAASLFGARPATSPFGTLQGTPGQPSASPFGTLQGTPGQPAAQPAAPPSTSLFGARPATSPFGTLQGTPGQPAAQPAAPPSTSLFGARPTTSPFGTLQGTPGQPAAQPAAPPSTSLFGASSLFGANPGIGIQPSTPPPIPMSNFAQHPNQQPSTRSSFLPSAGNSLSLLSSSNLSQGNTTLNINQNKDKKESSFFSKVFKPQ
ncbi:hypothetical protein NEDG_01160 [Nematocida displodere]|uniref:Uncharacterized protein n=1 Tax=Nematocida displodere TaxID=1805483 RepID=A0A177EBY8_9MICR|nr:hypothetical protein NEDG_01160 [Nematocida displodere]